MMALLRQRVVLPLLRQTSRADRLLTRMNEGLEVADLVTEPYRYVWDHVRRCALGVYTLRRTETRVCIRHPHGGADSLTLEEIFGSDAYRLPADVTKLVAAHGGTIIDLGANIGLSALWFDEAFPGQHVTSFEPDPANARILERCAALNKRDWTIFEAAASNEDGELRFQAGLEWASRADDSGDITVPSVDIFPYLAEAALLKIDIEGGEWNILTDARFRQITVPVVILEHHDHLCPDSDPRQTAISCLEGAGYLVHHGEEYEAGKGILWGILSPVRHR